MTGQKSYELELYNLRVVLGLAVVQLRTIKEGDVWIEAHDVAIRRGDKFPMRTANEAVFAYRKSEEGGDDGKA